MKHTSSESYIPPRARSSFDEYLVLEHWISKKQPFSYFARVLSEEVPGESKSKIESTDMTECRYIRQVNDLTIGLAEIVTVLSQWAE